MPPLWAAQRVQPKGRSAVQIGGYGVSSARAAYYEA